MRWTSSMGLTYAPSCEGESSVRDRESATQGSWPQETIPTSSNRGTQTENEQAPASPRGAARRRASNRRRTSPKPQRARVVNSGRAARGRRRHLKSWSVHTWKSPAQTKSRSSPFSCNFREWLQGSRKAPGWVFRGRHWSRCPALEPFCQLLAEITRVSWKNLSKLTFEIPPQVR